MTMMIAIMILTIFAKLKATIQLEVRSTWRSQRWYQFVLIKTFFNENLFIS